jgi:hypothetical protein
MMTDNAINRLLFTISKQNKPNKTDFESLKTLAEWIERSKKEEIRNNYLFAKMYVYNFTHEVLHYKDSFKSSYGISQKKIHQVLEMPLERIIDIAREKINTNEYNLFTKSIGLSRKFVRTPEEIESDTKLIEDNQDDFVKFGFGYFDKTEFEENIINQITESINKYKDKI